MVKGGNPVTTILDLKPDVRTAVTEWYQRLLAARETYNAAVQPAREAYDAAVQPAGKAYRAAVQPAREAYDAAVQSAGEAYDAAVQPAGKAYNAAVQSAGKAYDAVVQPARKAYNAAVQSAGKAYDAAVQPAQDSIELFWPGFNDFLGRFPKEWKLILDALPCTRETLDQLAEEIGWCTDWALARREVLASGNIIEYEDGE